MLASFHSNGNWPEARRALKREVWLLETPEATIHRSLSNVLSRLARFQFLLPWRESRLRMWNTYRLRIGNLTGCANGMRKWSASLLVLTVDVLFQVGTIPRAWGIVSQGLCLACPSQIWLLFMSCKMVRKWELTNYTGLLHLSVHSSYPGSGTWTSCILPAMIVPVSRKLHFSSEPASPTLPFWK